VLVTHPVGSGPAAQARSEWWSRVPHARGIAGPLGLPWAHHPGPFLLPSRPLITPHPSSPRPAGKSTLLNRLCGSEEAYADDLLFATLDPTTRRVRLPGGKEVAPLRPPCFSVPPLLVPLHHAPLRSRPWGTLGCTCQPGPRTHTITRLISLGPAGARPGPEPDPAAVTSTAARM
jgi:hypothetical protein